MLIKDEFDRYIGVWNSSTHRLFGCPSEFTRYSHRIHNSNFLQREIQISAIISAFFHLIVSAGILRVHIRTHC